MEAEVQLKRIHTKLLRLLKENTVLQEENSQLKTELNEMKMLWESRQETMDNLKQQVHVLKYTNGELSETEKKEFEKKINSYLKEIDRCITMLGQ